MISGTVRRRRRPPRRTVARHHIRDELQRMILEGDCKPGSKLVQQGLADKFGVSQSVVREALLDLRVNGLVETVDNRGVFVGKLDLKTLLDSYDVRAVHEGLAVRLCVDRITRADLRVLREYADRMCALGEAGKFEPMASLDREFHQFLLRLSGNGMLVRLAENYGLLGKVVRVGRDPRVVRREHLAILDAIEANDPERAERLMRAHIQTGKQRIEELAQAGKFVPQWVR